MTADVVTFGCRLNIHESEVIRRHVADRPDMVVINTCAVTAEAVRQAKQAIRRIRRERPGARIVVTGCAAQTEPQSFAAMAEVDRVIGNDVDADGKSLIMITGANEGGKSTFLRSVGLAQLMMRCGMFVPAESLRASVAVQVFSHYKREEDASLRSGKFDEELARMSDIADELTPNSLILFNESFAATNEREGSEIARQIIQALTDRGVTVVFVTHLFDLAHSLYARKLDTALFLRAQRRPDGRRTFRLAPGEPTPTSHGEDLYRQVFGGQAESDPEAESDVTVS